MGNKCKISDNINFVKIFKPFSTYDSLSLSIYDVAIKIGEELDQIVDLTDPQAEEYLAGRLQEYCKTKLGSKKFLEESSETRKKAFGNIIDNIDEAKLVAYYIINRKAPEAATDEKPMEFSGHSDFEDDQKLLATKVVYRQLYDIYRSALPARSEMEKSFKLGLISAALVDYKSGTLVSTTELLNRNIAEFKLKLVNNILEYFNRTIGRGSPIQIKLYNEEGIYQNTMNSLKSKIQELFKDFDDDTLNDLYKDRHTSSSSNIALKAFNSWVMLNNFDMLLQHFLDKSIKILKGAVGEELDIDSNKYQLVDEAGTVHTWRVTEEINALDELGNVTNLLIESIPMFEYNNGDSRELTDLTLTLADFAFAFLEVFKNKDLRSITSKIKSNMGNYIPLLIEAALTKLFGANTNLVKNVLYSVQRRIYKGGEHTTGDYSLTLIMVNSQNSPGYQAGVNYVNYISSVIDKSILNILLSYEFDAESHEITVKESYDRTTSNRELAISQSIENQNQALRRIPEQVKKLADTYKIYNAKEGRVYIDIPAFNGVYRILFVNRIGKQSTTTTDACLLTIHYIPNNGTKKLIYNVLHSGKVYTPEFAADVTKSEQESLFNLLLNFADDTLNLNFRGNPELLLMFAKNLPGVLTSNGTTTREKTGLEALIELIPTCARVSIKHNIESNTELSVIDETTGKFKFIRNDNILYDYFSGYDPTEKLKDPKSKDKITLKALLRTSGDDICLKALALARMAINGELSKGTVKNIEGNSVATTGLMNLMATTFIGWEDSKRRILEELDIKRSLDYEKMKRMRGSVIYNNLFITNPSVFVRYVIKSGGKGYDPSQIKPYKKFSVNESMQSAMLYDFLLNFGELNGGHVNMARLRFLPTVYSDKTRNYLIEIDGTSELAVNGVNKSIVDLSIEDYRILHYNSLRSLYLKLQSNLIKDYREVLLGFVNNIKNLPGVAPYLNGIDLQLLSDSTPITNDSSFLIYNEFTKLFSRINLLFDNKINIPVDESKNLLDFKNAKELYKYLSRKSGIEYINNVHYNDSSKKLEENKVLRHYFNMFTVANEDKFYYNHIVERNKLRFAQEVALNLELYYSKDKDPDPIIDRAFNRLAKIAFERAKKAGSKEKDIYYGKKVEDIKLDLISKWVDSNTGKLIIAKYGELGVDPKSLTKRELLALDISAITGKDSVRTENNIYLNPVVEIFLAADTFFSLEFINSTVGGCYVHKNNFKSLKSTDEIDRLEEEDAGRYLSLFKRMVIFPATMHPLHLEVLEGTATKYNIASIEDILALVWDYKRGKSDNTIDAHDGSGFCSPEVSEWENGSLLGAHAGDVKKPIGHWYNDAYGTSTLLKYALFPLSNEAVRNSSLECRFIKDSNGKYIPENEGDSRFGVSLKRIRYKMSNASWDSILPEGIHIDLTKNFKGETIQVSQLESTYYWDPETRKYYLVTNIEKNTDIPNSYIVTRETVNRDGSIIEGGTIQEEVIIDNNFALWQVFGGEWSMSLVNKRLEMDESSVKNVAYYGNNVGFVRHQDNLIGMEYIREKRDELGKLNDNIHIITDPITGQEVYKFDYMVTLKDIFQPLKYTGVHYLVNKSAVKSGQTNINGVNSWYNNDTLNYKSMWTSNFGIQMDADHHADDSDLSEMTQVISALEANGWGHDVVKFIYEDLGNIVSLSMSNSTKALMKFFQTGNTLDIYRILGRALLNSYAEEESGKANLTDAIIRNLLEEVELSLDVANASTHLPMSDNAIMNDIIKTVTSKINKSAIKRRYAGMGAVMVPAYNLIKVYKSRNKEGKFTDTLLGRSFKHNTNGIADTFNYSPVVESNGLDLGGSYVLVLDTTLGEGVPMFECTINGRKYYIGSELLQDPDGTRISHISLYNPETGNVDDEATQQYLKDESELSLKYRQSLYYIRKLLLLEKYGKLHIQGDFTEAIRNATLQNLPEEAAKKYYPTYAQILSIISLKGANNLTDEDNMALDDIASLLGIDRGDVNIMITPFSEVALPLARIELDTVSKYYKYRNNSNLRFREDYSVGRNLQPAKTTFTIGGVKYNIFDIDAVKNRMTFNEFFNKYKDDCRKNDFDVSTILLDEEFKKIALKNGYSVRAVNLKKKIELLIRHNNPLAKEYVKRYLLWIDLELEKDIVKSFKAVHNGGQVRVGSIDADPSKGIPYTPGNLVTVDENSAEMRPAEIVMSKAYATKFGILVGDNVSDIDFAYFKKLLINNFRTIPDATYDIVLRRTNGRHTYIVLKDTGTEEVLKSEYKCEKIEPLTYTDPETGKTVRLDNETKLELSSWEDCELYRNSRGDEFIVTDNVEQFLEDESYTSWSLNPYILDEEDERRSAEYLNAIVEILSRPEIETSLELFENDYEESRLFVHELWAQKIISDEEKVTLLRYIDKKQKGIQRRPLSKTGSEKPTQIIESLRKNSSLPEVDYYNFKKHVNKEANKKFVSFQQSLRVIAARIPSQSLQSFMSMKVVGFTESTENRAYVSHFQAYLQGSDYDIDKVYLMGSEFTEDGKYIGWSPLFDFFSIKTLEKSQEFPMPNSIQYNVEISQEDLLDSNSTDITQLVTNLFESWKSMNSSKDNQNRITKENSIINYLNNLKNLLIFVQNSPNVKLFIKDSGQDSDFSNYISTILKLINSHTMYLTKIKSKDTLLKITKNSVSARILLIADLPENTYAAYSPIEMETAQEAATQSTAGNSERGYNTMNPATKFHMFEQNMMGKDGIGIAATGVKVLFALLYYYNEALRGDISLLDSPEFKRQRNAYFDRTYLGLCKIGPIKEDVIRNVIANVNWEGEAMESLWKKRILQNIKDYNDAIERTNKEIAQKLASGLTLTSDDYTLLDRLLFLKDMIELLLNYMQDSSLVNSSLLSAATDNAKELILAKINASPDMMKIYLYGIIVGIDFNDISSLMTSETVNALTALSVSNIFEGSIGIQNIKSAVNKVLKGLTLDRLIPYTFKNTIGRAPAPGDTPDLLAILLLLKFTIPKYVENLKSSNYDAYTELSSNFLPGLLLNIFRDVNSDENSIKVLALNYLDHIKVCRKQLGNLKGSVDNFILKKVYQILETYEEFFDLLNRINFEEFQLFLEMLESADEISELGLNLSINQGIRTSIAEKMIYLDTIENAFDNRIKTIQKYLKKDFKLFDFIVAKNLERYTKLYLGIPNIDPKEKAMTVITEAYQRAEKLGIFDDFNAFNFVYDLDYLDAAVDAYDLIKKTINRLDVIRTLPHFRAMIKAATDDFMMFDRCVSKIDIMYNYAHRFNKEDSQSINKREKERFYRNMQSYIDAKIITKFFKDNKNTEIITSIPIYKGSFINPEWKSLEVMGVHNIDLSTIEGLATFKLWMETLVIPNLKDGYLDDNRSSSNSILPLNAFIKDLTLNSTDRTTTGHLKYLYTLPINMMDTDSDFNSNMIINYTSLFDKLNDSYNGIPIKLLFFYYNLIVNRGAMGLLTLTTIFKNAVSENKGNNRINEFFKWMGIMDSKNLLKDKDINYKDMFLSCAIEKSKTWMQSSKNKNGKYPEYVKVKNTDTGFYDIYKFDPSLLSDDLYTSEDPNIDIYEDVGEDFSLEGSFQPIGYKKVNIGLYNGLTIDEIADLMPYLVTLFGILEGVYTKDRLLRLAEQGKILVYNNCE